MGRKLGAAFCSVLIQGQEPSGAQAGFYPARQWLQCCLRCQMAGGLGTVLNRPFLMAGSELRTVAFKSTREGLRSSGQFLPHGLAVVLAGPLALLGIDDLLL